MSMNLRNIFLVYLLPTKNPSSMTTDLIEPYLTQILEQTTAFRKG